MPGPLLFFWVGRGKIAMVELHGYTTEARRWAKFPATLLFATGFLWLLESLFSFNMDNVGQQSETGVGALALFINFAVIPLGSVVIALGMLFVQRWALILGPLLGLYPLVALSISKVARIQLKFAEYRSGSSESSFGDGVMTSLLLMALWAIFGLMVLYVLKSLGILAKSQQWLSQPAGDEATVVQGAGDSSGDAPGTEMDDVYCSMFPAAGTKDDD